MRASLPLTTSLQLLPYLQSYERHYHWTPLQKILWKPRCCFNRNYGRCSRSWSIQCVSPVFRAMWQFNLVNSHFRGCWPYRGHCWSEGHAIHRCYNLHSGWCYSDLNNRVLDDDCRTSYQWFWCWPPLVCLYLSKTRRNPP